MNSLRWLVFGVLYLLQTSGNVQAQPVSLETSVRVYVPERWNGETCSTAVYRGSLQELFSNNLFGSPILRAWTEQLASPAINDPAANRAGLVIAAASEAQTTAKLRIEGLRTSIQEIERKLQAGDGIALTEFQQCAASDPALTLVQLVNFEPMGRRVPIASDAKITVIRKDPDGACSVFRQSTLGDIIHAYFPNMDVSGLQANVAVLAGGVATESGELRGKHVVLTFFTEMPTLHHYLAISMNTMADMSYDIVKKLQEAGGNLQLTGSPECMRAMPNALIWAEGVQVNRL